MSVQDLDASEFISGSSVDNVPSDLRPLMGDIKRITEQVYGEWIAINWHGSIPRGDFIFGVSDADITIITKSDLLPGQREQRIELLNQILAVWVKRGIPKLDVMAIAQSELHDEDRRASLFYCITDGFNIEGSKNIDLSFVLPSSRLELVQLLNSKLAAWVKDVKERGPEDIKGIEQVKKRTIRGIYGLAIMNGAPYIRSWRQYQDSIGKFVNEYVAEYQWLLEGKDLDFNSLLSLAEKVKDELARTGVKYDTGW